MAARWQMKNFRNVALGILVNGSWLGFLGWLVFGLWLELASFLVCWVVVALIQFPISVWKETARINGEENPSEYDDLEVMRAESTAFSGDLRIRAVLSELRLIGTESGAEGLRYISSEIGHQILSNAAHVQESLDIEGATARLYCLSVIYNYLRAELPTGQHHIYRNTLSQSGQSLLKLWDFVIDQMLENGILEPDGAEAEKKWMRDEVARAG